MSDENLIVRFSYKHIMNALLNIEKVPQSRLDNLHIHFDPITGHGFIAAGQKLREVGEFKYFEGIEQPLFLWTHSDYFKYKKHSFALDETTGAYLPQFRPTLSVHKTPCFEIDGEHATFDMWLFLRGMLTNLMSDERYTLSQEAGAFFQGGAHDENGEWFLIEFWKSKGVPAFIDYMNRHYRHK